jgi:parallel beta-helix repeat protein
VNVVGCVLRDSGDTAAHIADGTSNVIDGALIHDTGEGGVGVAGGDRPTLTKAGNTVENSDIHDFSQFVWTYTPAVNVSGDGVVVKNNVLHGSPHTAILYGGSQHTFSENEIYGVCGFTSDAGAIYSGRDWSARGNVIEYNFIHDIASNMKGGYGVHAIYLDDCLSGITVNGNIAYNVTGFGIEHGGGRDNLMTNNIFVNCETAVLEADSRCAGTPTPVSNVAGSSWNLLAKLEAVSYQQDPWASTFPSCAAIPDDYATVTAAGSPWLEPQGCTFVNNLGFSYGAWTNASASTLAAYASITGNVQGQDPLFVGEANLNLKAAVSKTPLALQPGSPVIALQGGNPTPFASIGIQP